jgi:probable rRNA maturation factor
VSSSSSGPVEPGVPSVRSSDNRTGDRTEVDLDALSELFAAALHREGISPQAEASLTLLDPGEIALLKQQYLDGDGSATDVLSFPMDGAICPEESAGGPSTWMVGDLLLCPQVAATQAPEHAGNLNDELEVLVIHGTLHLLGWDHVEKEERKLMWQRERELFTALRGAPERDPWSEEDYNRALGAPTVPEQGALRP